MATDAWLATRPLESASAPPDHPLAMPEYRVEAMERADLAQKASDDASDQAAHANHIGDLYVLATVLLATIITVSSLGSRLSTRGARRASLAFCGVVLLVVIVWLALRPIAWVGHGA